MKVSIVIPAYNAEKYLALTLSSVLAQTVADWECVIVDDGSRDGTKLIAESYAARDSRVRVAGKQNGGVASARNHGFTQTSPDTEAVVFLDSDDVWEPEFLAVLTDRLQTDPDAAGAYGLARYIDGSGNPTQAGVLEEWASARRRLERGAAVLCRPEERTTFACLALGQCIPTPGVLLVRRAVMEAAGNFDASTTPSEDYDLSLRLTRRGELAFVCRVLAGYRLHESNASGDKRSLHRSERTVRRTQIRSRENTPEQKRLLQRGFRLREQELYHARMRDAWAGLRRRDFAGSAKTFLYGQANLLRAFRGLS